jgi:hypothetical protein
MGELEPIFISTSTATSKSSTDVEAASFHGSLSCDESQEGPLTLRCVGLRG